MRKLTVRPIGCRAIGQSDSDEEHSETSDAKNNARDIKLPESLKGSGLERLAMLFGRPDLGSLYS
jgi:hypothetical protein